MIKRLPVILAVLIVHSVVFGQGSSVQDDLGRTVSCISPPKRIISLAPSLTETLFALGLDSSIVGVTDFCNYPPSALMKSKVGGMNNPNLEQIASLRPDLIVMSISGNTRSDFDKLISLGKRVFVSDPRSIDGVFKSIRDLGTLCHRPLNARLLIDTLSALKERLIRSAQSVPGKSALMLLSLRPIIAVGNGTFIDELLGLANARNVTHDSPTAYPLIGREEILRLQPDVILVTTDIAHSVRDILAEYPEWKSLNALESGHVAFVDADLISRPGPRIVRGLEQIIHAIHGE